MTSIPSGTNGPRSLAVSSTGDEWAKTGRSLFRQGRYAHAEQCFKKANLHDEELVANAYRLREEAQDVPPDEDDSAVEHKRAFTAAAEAFIKSAASAILEKAIYYRIAAECFKECGNPPRAAQSYVDAGEFDIGAQLYRDAELFSQAIQVVREHRDKMQPDVVAGIEDDCRRHYFRNNELVYVFCCLPFQLFPAYLRFYSRARSLFSSDKEALDFTENHDLNEAHVALLIKFDRRADAAQFYLSKGRTHEAHEILAQDHKNVLSVSRVTQYILSGLWEHFSLGLVPVNKRTKQVVRERLRLSTLLNDAMLNSNDRDEVRTTTFSLARCYQSTRPRYQCSEPFRRWTWTVHNNS
jgi:tetratricopeptide (TPR) repeat protein